MDTITEDSTFERCSGIYRNDYVSQKVMYVTDVLKHFDYKFNIRVTEITWS